MSLVSSFNHSMSALPRTWLSSNAPCECLQIGNNQFEDVLRQVSPLGIADWQVGAARLRTFMQYSSTVLYCALLLHSSLAFLHALCHCRVSSVLTGHHWLCCPRPRQLVLQGHNVYCKRVDLECRASLMCSAWPAVRSDACCMSSLPPLRRTSISPVVSSEQLCTRPAGAAARDEAAGARGHAAAARRPARRPGRGADRLCALCTRTADGHAHIMPMPAHPLQSELPVMLDAALHSKCWGRLFTCLQAKEKQVTADRLAAFLICVRSLIWQGGLDAMKLLGPFSTLLDGVVTDTFVRNWVDLLCFLLSGAAPAAAHCPGY